VGFGFGGGVVTDGCLCMKRAWLWCEGVMNRGGDIMS